MKTILFVLLMTSTVSAANPNCKNQFNNSYWFQKYRQFMQVFPLADNPKSLGYAEVTIIDHNRDQNSVTKPSNGSGYSVRISPAKSGKINGFPKNLEFNDLEFISLRDRRNGYALGARGLMWMVGPAQDAKTAIVPRWTEVNRNALLAIGVRDFAIINEYMGGEAKVVVINTSGEAYYGYLPRTNSVKSN